jgi:hypothetical protein
VAHVRELAALGIPENNQREWTQLIGMRYEEYASDRHKARAASMQIEVEAARRPLDQGTMEGIQAMVPVQVVTIGSHCHICRGKTEDMMNFSSTCSNTCPASMLKCGLPTKADR